MKPHEKQAIEQLFARLAEARRLPLRWDAAAERLIAELVARQPDAPYLMAQTILVQARALRAAQDSLDAHAGQTRPPRTNGATRRPNEQVPSSRPTDAAAPDTPGASDGFLQAAASVALAVGGAIAVETGRS